MSSNLIDRPMKIIDASKVTRFEVIDEGGRSYVRYNVKTELSFQDDGRTLKVFVKALPIDPKDVERNGP